MSSPNKGWVKIHRVLLDNAIWECTTTEQKVVAITCLLLANHREVQWVWQKQKFSVMPGSFITSLSSLAARAGVTIQNVRTALAKFEKIGFLTNESTKCGRLITLVNWRIYQGWHPDDQQRDQQTTTKELTTNNNVKKPLRRDSSGTHQQRFRSSESANYSRPTNPGRVRKAGTGQSEVPVQ